MDRKLQDLVNINNTLCRRCHRKLKDADSIKLGFGKICYTKYKQSTKNYLFELKGGELNESGKCN